MFNRFNGSSGIFYAVCNEGINALHIYINTINKGQRKKIINKFSYKPSMYQHTVNIEFHKLTRSSVFVQICCVRYFSLIV